MNPNRASPASDAQHAREDREHAGQGDGLRLGSPAARGTIAAAISGASEESGPRTRIRLGPNEGVRDQRNDRRVEPVDGGQARRLRVAHAGGDQQRGEDEPGDEVAGQPGPLVGAEGPGAGEPPPDPARCLRGRCSALRLSCVPTSRGRRRAVRPTQQPTATGADDHQARTRRRRLRARRRDGQSVWWRAASSVAGDFPHRVNQWATTSLSRIILPQPGKAPRDERHERASAAALRAAGRPSAP